MGATRPNSLRINPIPPQLVNAVWIDALPFLVEAIDNSDNEVTVAYVHQQCINGVWDMWVATRGDSLVGFTILEPLWSAKGMWVNIVFAGFDKDLRVMNKVLRRIEEVAESTGACGVKYISADRRFGSYAERKGYRERYREYVKEF